MILQQIATRGKISNDDEYAQVLELLFPILKQKCSTIGRTYLMEKQSQDVERITVKRQVINQTVTFLDFILKIKDDLFYLIRTKLTVVNEILCNVDYSLQIHNNNSMTVHGMSRRTKTGISTLS